MFVRPDVNPHGLACYTAPGVPRRQYNRTARKRFVSVLCEDGTRRDVKSYRVKDT